MIKLILGIPISVWISLGALVISALSLRLSIRNNRFNRKMEAAKIPTNLIQRILLARDAFRELKSSIDECEELNDDFPKAEIEDYRKTVKEVMDTTKIIHDLAKADIIDDPVELERHVANAEALIIGARRRIRETTTAIDKLKDGNDTDRSRK